MVAVVGDRSLAAGRDHENAVNAGHEIAVVGQDRESDDVGRGQTIGANAGQGQGQGHAHENACSGRINVGAVLTTKSDMLKNFPSIPLWATYVSLLTGHNVMQRI